MVLITIASVGPAVWSHNPDLVREQAIQLALAALATALCIVERRYSTPRQSRRAGCRHDAAGPDCVHALALKRGQSVDLINLP